jgi:hypothetical protein
MKDARQHSEAAHARTIRLTSSTLKLLRVASRTRGNGRGRKVTATPRCGASYCSPSRAKALNVAYCSRLRALKAAELR